MSFFAQKIEQPGAYYVPYQEGQKEGRVGIKVGEDGELPKPTFIENVKEWCATHPTTVKVLNMVAIILCIAGTVGMIIMAPMIGIPLAVVIALCIMNGILIMPSIVTIVAFEQLFPPRLPSEESRA